MPKCPPTNFSKTFGQCYFVDVTILELCITYFVHAFRNHNIPCGQSSSDINIGQSRIFSLFFTEQHMDLTLPVTSSLPSGHDALATPNNPKSKRLRIYIFSPPIYTKLWYGILAILFATPKNTSSKHLYTMQHPSHLAHNPSILCTQARDHLRHRERPKCHHSPTDTPNHPHEPHRRLLVDIFHLVRLNTLH